MQVAVESFKMGNVSHLTKQGISRAAWGHGSSEQAQEPVLRSKSIILLLRLHMSTETRPGTTNKLNKHIFKRVGFNFPSLT